MNQARYVAAKAIIRCEGGGYSQLVLDSAVQADHLSPRDTAFASAIFYGVLERRVTLDAIIAQYARHPLSIEVRVVLRCAILQMVFLDAVEDFAAVNESVECIRALGQTSATSTVNGILRAFLRNEKRIPKGKDPLTQLCIDYSCSADVARLLLQWLGPEKAAKALAASLGRPPVFARINTLKTDQESVIQMLEKEGIAAAATVLPNAITITGNAAHSVAHRKGLFSIQDISAQKAALALEAMPGERILDLCAAPGSKAFLLAQQMQNKGTLLCCDLSQKRLELVDRGAKRLAANIIKTRVNDGTVFNPALGLFDRVICDAPCSGLGVIRRKPELKYRDRLAVGSLVQTQYNILATASQYLQPGGVLLYSTCTINPLENALLVSRILEADPTLTPYPWESGNYTHQNDIGEDGGDGFFTARLRKKI